MTAVKEYRALIAESQYNRVVKEAIVIAADAAIAELDAMLEIAYESADFEEPLTLNEYKADLREQADARARYLSARAERSTE